MHDPHDWRGSIDDMYSDEEAREILRRAKEIDAAEPVSTADIMSIADNANISKRAIERALTEAALDRRVGRGKDIDARERQREMEWAKSIFYHRFSYQHLLWIGTAAILALTYVLR